MLQKRDATYRISKEVEQWFHISCVASEVFTLICVHFLGIPMLLVGAIVVDMVFSTIKYIFLSPFNAIYWTVGHSFVIWPWAIGTLIYFIYVGPWWLGAYALAYVLILSGIVGIPGMLLVDRIAVRKLGQRPKMFAASKFIARGKHSRLPIGNKIFKLEVGSENWKIILFIGIVAVVGLITFYQYEEEPKPRQTNSTHAAPKHIQKQVGDNAVGKKGKAGEENNQAKHKPTAKKGNRKNAMKLLGESRKILFGERGIRPMEENFQAALKKCNKAIEVDPDLAIAHIVRAQFAMQEEDWVTSIKYFEKGLALLDQEGQPLNPPGQLPGAEASIEEVEGDAYCMLCIAYLHQAQEAKLSKRDEEEQVFLSKAHQSLKKGLRLKPSPPMREMAQRMLQAFKQVP